MSILLIYRYHLAWLYYFIYLFFIIIIILDGEIN